MNEQELLKAIRVLAGGSSPDTDIAEFLYRHRCYYLLSTLPRPLYAQALTAENALNRIAVKERYKACRSLFEQISFPYAVIKGAVLSHMAYGDPFVRHSGDIDLLICRKDADALKALLLSLGFVQGRITDGGIVPFSRHEILFQATASHQSAPYVKQTGNPLCPYVNVDVNMDILWGESEEKADMDTVLANTERTVLLDVPFRKLTAEMEFIALCLHHYKDMHSLYLLSGGSMRLSLFCDLYYYLRNVHPGTEKLRALARALRVEIGRAHV